MDTEALSKQVAERYPEQAEFLQAVRSTLHELDPLLERHPEYAEPWLFERLLEPDRVVQFRVDWEDDDGRRRVSRGYRVQWSDVLGPYKGGLRFHPSVTPSVLKFLAFEQVFKNALTDLDLGGAKGGADVDLSGQSEGTVRRFCQAFVTELHRHVGAEQDVPAGDIGVGAREIGFLYAQLRRLQPLASQAFTGKPVELGGSALREQATGWGVVYFAEHVLERRDRELEDLRCVVSGAGNVARYAAEKLRTSGARVLTLSDTSGTLFCEDGLGEDHLEAVSRAKSAGGSLSDVADETGLEHRDGAPWDTPCDAAFPCATQNEVDAEAARSLVDGGCRLVCEGANMPCDDEAREIFRESDTTFAPGKAANAGGVAVSEFEMAQAASRQRWSAETVDERLREVMSRIHDQCVEWSDVGGDDERVDYEGGATRAAFVRVAEALRRQ